MTTPVELLANLVVGAVESVSSAEIRVLLELDAPNSTALNTGTPAAFPRINGYVLLPNEAGATVAYVSWIGIERSPYPKRSGFKDFGLVDLPFPLRKMTVCPVGTLYSRRTSTGMTEYHLSRGVIAFPSVGDQVLLPTSEQVMAIVGASKSDRRVRIGVSPLSPNAPIMVDPDKIFGRHLAVLGNTGSGKSCTVAGLIRWSLEAAAAEIAAKNRIGVPNARFIVLDPNGEYARAFEDLGNKTRLFRVPPVTTGERELDVPAWLWSGHEWTAVAHAQPGAQRPLLFQGIRELKCGKMEGVPREATVRRYLLSYAARLSSLLNSGTQAFSGSPRPRFECARLLQTIAEECSYLGDTATGVAQLVSATLGQIREETLKIIADRKSKSNPNYFDDFLVADLEKIRSAIIALVETLPDWGVAAPISEDSPLFFDVNMLAEHLEKIATEQGGAIAGFISTLGLRIRGMLADPRLGKMVGRTPPVSFESWLTEYIGDNGAKNGQLAIIDLSLVPSEIIHIVVAVLARLVFEATQRYRRQDLERRPLPTVLVLEEAHTFVRRSFDSDESIFSPAQLCRETFERIAREGRKFGLGLVLSSQRPSELSPTALAQCNTFILHRIVNDADQGLVSRLVPDNLGGLLKELPSLPSRQCVLLGWATPIPVLVEIDELSEETRPRSSDPDYWDVWTLEKKREIDWKKIVDEWTNLSEAITEPPAI
jgi:hypothetical protein